MHAEPLFTMCMQLASRCHKCLRPTTVQLPIVAQQSLSQFMFMQTPTCCVLGRGTCRVLRCCMGVNSSLRGRDAPLASGCSPSTPPSFALSHTGLSNTPWKYVAPNSTFPRPGLSWVWTRPPSLSPASKTRTLRSRSASTSALAAARPANPPPITTTVGILRSLADEERWPRSKQQIHSSCARARYPFRKGCLGQIRLEPGFLTQHRHVH